MQKDKALKAIKNAMHLIFGDARSDGDSLVSTTPMDILSINGVLEMRVSWVADDYFEFKFVFCSPDLLQDRIYDSMHTPCFSNENDDWVYTCPLQCIVPEMYEDVELRIWSALGQLAEGINKVFFGMPGEFDFLL